MAVNSYRFRDLPPSQIVPILADEGIYLCSESSMYRLLRAQGQVQRCQTGASHKRHKPKACTAYRHNEVWSWDITYLPTDVRGLFYYLYLILDIYSRKIVGWSIHAEQSSELAARVTEQACLDESIQPGQVILHSDNGSPMKGCTQLVMLEKLGISSSFSRPSVSNDNPYVESLFRTLKYRPNFPWKSHFETLGAARIWMGKFTRWYNDEHRHSGLNYVTPSQRHEGADTELLAKRASVYKLARGAHPERWSGQTRNWSSVHYVTLNPSTESIKPTQEMTR